MFLSKKVTTFGTYFRVQNAKLTLALNLKQSWRHMGLSNEQYYENKARLTGYSEVFPTRRVLPLASGHGLETLAFQKMVIYILCTHPTTATKNS